ncbi:MAG: hypothetical protein JXA25_06635 [Anaerolineales bacterium]|nr:hypothetical protein [Anaerolineales bacterium]
MVPLNESMKVYKQQLQKGEIIRAHQGLMQYFRDLKAHLENRYPDYSVSGSIYYGYMDMTYFSFIPPSLGRLSLKPAIVFVYETFRFEIWLAAKNKKVQTKYWNLIRESGWDKYDPAPKMAGYDHIISHILVGDPDFQNLDQLTAKIEKGTLEFISDVEWFLAQQDLL